MSARAWIPGPPPGRGRYWVVWRLKTGTRVEPVEISPALLYYNDPRADLLIKMIKGSAYEFSTNRDDITHHMPLDPPEAP